MDYLTWTLINGLVGSINFLMNAFYIFCMVRPLHGEKIKQPLKLLLAMLIGSTTIYLMANFGVVFSEEKEENDRTAQVSSLLSVSCLSIGVSSSVWLNFFYYTQIVPAQRALFIWIKKNIKPIIFCIIIFEKIFSFVDVTLVLLDASLVEFEFNTTFTKNQVIPVRDLISNSEDIFTTLESIKRFHFYSSFLVMMMSSSATVAYLCRHMQRMVANGEHFSCPRFSSQVRVTITGIVQGLVYLSLAVWTEYTYIVSHYESTSIGPYIRSTVINFYMSAIGFNLGAGQAVFRQRAADIWTRATKWHKTLMVQPPDYGA